MSKKISKLEREARLLPLQERARLVRRLIMSLESENLGNVEQAWFDEADRRLEAYRRGETGTLPGEDVFEAVLNRT